MRPQRCARIAGNTACVLNCDRLIEIRFGQFIDTAHDADAGVVDQHVDRTELAGDAFDHRGDGCGLRYIGGNPQDAVAATAMPPNGRGNRLGRFRLAVVVEGDRSARLGTGHRDCGADAA